MRKQLKEKNRLKKSENMQRVKKHRTILSSLVLSVLLMLGITVSALASAIPSNAMTDLTQDMGNTATTDTISSNKNVPIEEGKEDIKTDSEEYGSSGTRYTVEYQDGVLGEIIFSDQVYRDLERGEPTPTFKGTPERKGYKFIGWEPEVAATVTKNVVYVAQWVKVYTVRYTDGVDGKEVFADQVYEDIVTGTATPSFNGIPTREGYKFIGWEPEVAATVTKNAVYVAQWVKLYTVRYTDGVAEEEVFTDQVYEDIEQGTETPSFNGIPAREGYKFIGWEPEVAATVTKNAVYVAQWDKLYTVRYTDGVAEEEVFTDQVYTDIEKDTTTPSFVGTPERKGYKFIGWNLEVTATVTEDAVYVAQWDKLHTVRYTDGVDGKEVFTDQVYEDIEKGTATPSFVGTPERKGYKFIGWKPEVAATVTEDAVYVAQWEKVVDPVDPTTKPTETVTIKPSHKPSQSETNKPVTPKTGENSSLMLSIVLSSSAILLVLSVIVIKKNKDLT